MEASDFFCKPDDYSAAELDDIFAPLFGPNRLSYHTYKTQVKEKDREVVLTQRMAVSRTLKNGKPHGREVTAYKSGKLCVRQYDSGNLNGLQLELDGQVVKICFCRSGMTQGRALEYKRNTYVKRYVYVDGRKHGPYRYESDKHVVDARYYWGKKQGPYLITYADGRRETGEYSDDAREGKYSVTKDDQLVEEGTYYDGEKSGEVRYFKDGVLERTEYRFC